MSKSPDPTDKQETPTPPLPPPDDRARSPLPLKTAAIWMLLLITVFAMVQLYSAGRETTETIAYKPDFYELVEGRRIASLNIVTDASGGQHIQGRSLDVDPKTRRQRKFRVEVVITDGLLAWLDKSGVHYSFQRQLVDIWQVVQSAVPFIIVIGLLYFLIVRQMRSAGHGAMSFGKSRARLLTRESQKITFKHVAGVEEAKEEVQEIVEYLKDPKRFQKLGGRIPKGVLMMGPPGTGKTLLAKAIAGEADVPFFSISGSDFVEMFVGVGASRVRDMFEQGKKYAPCIIFIDEIDAVGRSRFSGIGGGHDEREQTLNALLVEMDGFETKDGVIIIAATNRPDVLDPALLRPGRFDRQIVIDLPLLEGRTEILKIHSAKVRMHPAVDLRRIARGTSGFSGADLANLINEAALLAARENKDAVENTDLEEARDKVKWGRERRSRVLDDEEKRLTAYHESGHAIVLQCVEKSEPLHKITIIPRGTSYLGATMQLPEKDRYTQSRIALKGMLAGLMAGRAAEELEFNDITTGAGSDLKEATRLARLMVCNWGMSRELGPQTFGAQEELLFLGREIARNQDFSEDSARRIDAEVNFLLSEAHDRALAILTEKRETLDRLARLLIERETLDGRDIEEIVKHGRLFTEEERAAADARAGQPPAITADGSASSDGAGPANQPVAGGSAAVPPPGIQTTSRT